VDIRLTSGLSAMAPFPNYKRSTPEQAIRQLQHFCGYRERCHEEVREKLRSLGVWRADQEEIVSKLIEGDYLNEERYARVYAGGKFRVNRWGRNKIRYSLKQNKVSEYCIRKGLAEIDEEEYDRVIERLAKAKMEQLTGHMALRKEKTMTYLIGRGFEADRIKPFLKG
jgi:regulatory protein